MRPRGSDQAVIPPAAVAPAGFDLTARDIRAMRAVSNGPPDHVNRTLKTPPEKRGPAGIE